MRARRPTALLPCYTHCIALPTRFLPFSRTASLLVQVLITSLKEIQPMATFVQEGVANAVYYYYRDLSADGFPPQVNLPPLCFSRLALAC